MSWRIRILAVAVQFASLPGCDLHGKPRVARMDTSAPRTEVPSSLAAPARIVAPGIVEPWDGDLELSARESGWIAKIAVVEGQAIEAGQLVAQLEDVGQRAGVDLARAELAEAEAVLARAMNGATAEELREAQADGEATRARAAFARDDANRMNHLGSADVVARAEVERANAEAQAQAASARARQARIAAVERGTRREDRAAARHRVAAARARLDLAHASLERRRLTSPIAGVVLLSRFHAGEFFAVGNGPLVVVGDMSRVRVRLEVDEIDATRIRRGAACAFFGEDGAKVGEGAVLRLAPRMGRRVLSIESPTARADLRVREVFADAGSTTALVPGQRVWGHIVP